MAPAPTYAAVSINTLDDLITASTTARQTPPNSEGHHFIASAIAAAVRKFTKAAASSRTGDHALRGSLSDGSDPLAVLMAPTTATETGAGAGRAATAKFGLAGMAILIARLEVDGDRTPLQPALEAFCCHLDAMEARLMPENISLLAEWVHYLFRDTRLTVELYRNLLSNYRPLEPRGTHTLTSWHASLMRCALATRSYDSVLDILRVPIDNIDFHYSTVTCQHHLLYHYYGGCILAAAGYHADAITFFETAVTVPGTAASAISLDAYKKYILVSLLSNGKAESLPKYTSNAVNSAFKNQCSVYLDFQTAFQSFDRTKVREIAKRNQETFVNDGNYGLLLQSLRRFKTQAILRLRRTYITVSMHEVAAAMEEDPLNVTEEHVTAAEAAILALIRDKEIYADITYASDGSATVTFLDDPEPYNTERTIQNLVMRINKAQDLGQVTQWTDDALARSKEFLQKALKQNYNTGQEESFLDDQDEM